MEWPAASTGNVFLKEAIETFRSYKKLGDKAMAQLDNASDLHWTPNSESNSIAVIVKHLRGNMLSRWTDFLTSDGEKPDRQRDEEFAGGEESAETVLAWWEEGWEVVFRTLSELTEEDLMRTVTIRQEPHSVVKAILRQISHYSYHVGQIVYIAKQRKAEGFESLSIPRRRP
ncbi:hypothetical protein J31TS4_30100 [Paenibacillus sp. J31TS4]|uniref:DUF1572 family protein n=1 Tax=Paenibacillus sp. J31TS4 TaxID=2807195 RepID=UPI001B27CC4E|nr:DUF1572 family protein [Paenibacillus sp. J31TS4]GIP39730.1 hypothetical protein J31TS4_30100 [Paenibacillus sp. J31TS4]